MSTAFIIEFLPDVGALIALIIGLLCVLNKKKDIKSLLILGGIFCVVEGGIYQLVMLLTSGGFVEGFNVGHLAYFGCYMFFIAYQSVLENSIINKPEKRKYLIPSIVSVVVFTAVYLFGLFKSDEYLIYCIIINLPLLPLSFICMRHIFCDVSKFDKYNCFLNLALFFFSLFRISLPFYGHEKLAVACGVAVAIILILIGLNFVSEFGKKEVSES